MKHPRLSNFLLFQREKNQMLVLDCRNERVYAISEAMLWFANHLDGHTDPFEIPSIYDEDLTAPFPKDKVEKMLEALKQVDFLRGSMVTKKWFSLYYALWLVHGTPDILSRFSKIIMTALRWLWLPVFLAGLLVSPGPPAVDEQTRLVSGLVGLGVGLILHFLSHVCAVIENEDTAILEAGFALRLPIPGPYVLFDDGYAGPMDKAGVYSAGIKVNLLLSGVCFMLAAFVPVCFALFYAGMANVLYGLAQTLPMPGTDGGKILLALLDIKKSPEGKGGGRVGKLWKYIGWFLSGAYWIVATLVILCELFWPVIG